MTVYQCPDPLSYCWPGQPCDCPAPGEAKRHDNCHPDLCDCRLRDFRPEKRDPISVLGRWFARRRAYTLFMMILVGFTLSQAFYGMNGWVHWLHVLPMLLGFISAASLCDRIDSGKGK